MEPGMAALAAAFGALSADLQSALESSGVNPDPGSKGGIREERLRQALGLHLPSRYEMSLGGVVVNAEGETSSPQDIVITDGLVARPFMFGNQIHPIEAVCAVIEVKSAYSKSDLTHGVEQVASVKRLLRKRLWRKHELDRIEAGDPEPSLFGAVFCYRMNSRADTITKTFLNACLTNEPGDRPDTLCVLNEFTTQWRSNQNMVPFSGGTPHGAKNLLRYDTADAALFFYMLLLDRLVRYQPPLLELMWYLNHGGPDIEVKDFKLPSEEPNVPT